MKYLTRLIVLLISPKTALRIALVFVAQFCILRGIGYLPSLSPERIPDGVATISVFVPLDYWAALWILAGVLALVSVVPCWPAGSGLCVVMCLVWAIGYTVTWVSALQGVEVRWFMRLPYPWLLTDGSPNVRDFLTASQYWLGLGLLACGYVLSRYALVVRGSGDRVAT